MDRYQNGKIYKLVNSIDNKIYVGSTCLTLTKRKHHHKATSIKFPNRAVYFHIIQIGWENIDIVLIENFPCQSKNELHRRERFFFDELKPELNYQVPTRTQKEYYDENKKEIKEIRNKYKESHIVPGRSLVSFKFYLRNKIQKVEGDCIELHQRIQIKLSGIK